ncbi:MAG TPA: 2-dehydropantoate 2-reductase [Anaerolineales bacterium]|nr:2-dehydropantoate 2-reductase [Anaerolineales bacterium]
MANLRILSFGAGAIGTYIGGSLALAGEQIVFVERPSVANELRQRGLRLNLAIDKRRKTNQIFALSPTAFVVAPSLEDALRYGPFDAALFALKSFDTASALEGMKSFAEKLPPMLCLSNGVENESTIANALGPDKVIPGIVASAVERRGPGDIVLERLRGIGIATSHPLSAKLLDAADSANLNPRAFSNAAAMKWSKMLTNLIANPTSAILNMSAAEILANPRLYEIEIRMLRECLAVMEAQRIPVVDLPHTPVRALAFATRLPMRISKPLLARAAGAGRGGKMPSFHIDLYSGRGESEVEYLQGAVARAGDRFGVPTPVNKILTETLMKLTNKKIPLEEFAHQPDKLLALM